MNSMHLSDGYKVDHRSQYPKNTTLVYSNWTPRKSRLEGVNQVVFFGLQYFIKRYLLEDFEQQFFKLPKAQVVDQYKRRIEYYLGKDAITYEHVEALHDLGYLPIEIKAIEEGNIVDMRIPMLTMKNTLPQFFWLTNFLESLMSCILWMPCTSATIAMQYRKLLDSYAKETSTDLEFVNWQGHDFSFRGMAGMEAAMMSGAAHLLSFRGTDTIPAIDFLEQYYRANAEQEFIAGSVPATEHSVMSMGMANNELETFKRMITKVYPKGIVSIVSDTWDYYKVLTEYLPTLKNEILSREGKVVIRPDSGDPVHIICGDPNAPIDSPAFKGSMECLWEVFGGHVNEKGYKELDPHIGLIYGDSITIDRCKRICEGLKRKGFASTNIVFGIGSFTYQYNTRDTFGFAMKATYGEVDGIGRMIFKDPITDNGTKKSAKGLLRLDLNSNHELELREEVSWEEEAGGLYQTIFKDGRLIKELSLQEIRDNLKNNYLQENRSTESPLLYS